MRRKDEKPVRIYVKNNGMDMKVTVPRGIVDAYGGVEEVEKYFQAALYRASSDLHFPELEREFDELYREMNNLKKDLMMEWMITNDHPAGLDLKVLSLQRKRLNENPGAAPQN